MKHLFTTTLFLLSSIALPLCAEPKSFESRNDVPEAYTWDLSVFYNDWSEWEADLEKLEADIENIAALQGSLAEGENPFLKLFIKNEASELLAYKLYGFAMLKRDVDQKNDLSQQYYKKLMSVFTRWQTQTAWINPEILTLPETDVLQWIDENEAIQPYRFQIENLFRQQAHILNKEEEKLLSLFGTTRSNPRMGYQALSTSDATYPTAVLSDGSELSISPGIYSKTLNQNENATDRLIVQEAWMKPFEAHKNTYANFYDGIIQQGWAMAQARGYDSTLSMSLDANKIPESVVYNLIDMAREGAPAIQRYHQLRKKALGLERYGWSDMFIPILKIDRHYNYEEIAPIILDSVSPLGPDYQNKMKEQLEGRKIDVFETPGKRSGAYNMGVYGVGSFVLLNFQGTLNDVFTAAHEMGHSMHTRLSQDNQPYATHDYTIFVAEVASIFNEKLLLRKLLKEETDPNLRIAYIEKQLQDIWGTFFIQVQMADYEVVAHKHVEDGGAITADTLTQFWSDIAKHYYGDLLPSDDAYKYSWARIPHLFNSPFYVYQYATCYASAAAMMQKIESAETPEARQRIIDGYLNLLKSGGNDYPMEQLKKAGIDLNDPAVIQSVITEFNELLDLLEEALQSRD